MPYSINGFGTQLVGERDFHPDGSHLTTEWFVLFMLPIVPLRSLRVIPAGVDQQHGPLTLREHYHVIEKKLPCARQVLSVYGFSLIYITFLVLWFLLPSPSRTLEPIHFGAGFLLALLLPHATPTMWRCRAKSRIYGSAHCWSTKEMLTWWMVLAYLLVWVILLIWSLVIAIDTRDAFLLVPTLLIGLWFVPPAILRAFLRRTNSDPVERILASVSRRLWASVWKPTHSDEGARTQPEQE